MSDITFQRLIEEKIEKTNPREILGETLYEDMLKIKDETQLDKTLFGFFNWCFSVNKVLSKYNFFMKFFKRSNKNKFLIEKKVERKSIVTSSVIEKFNAYQMRHKIEHIEKADFTPLNIVYEPLFDDKPLSLFISKTTYILPIEVTSVN